MDYGIIGNCKSAALVDRRGTVVWCCLPDFDSDSVFASMLDEEKGGSFGIAVDDTYTITQAYVPNTNVLRTVYESAAGGFELYDLMPRHKDGNQYYAPPELLRYLKRTHGKPVFTVRYRPRLGYAHYATESRIHRMGYIKSIVSEGGYESLYLYTDLRLDDILEERPISLAGDAFLLLSYHQKIRPMTLERAMLELERTKVYWMDWVERTTAFTAWNEAIRRSALVLKLLFYQETGAIMAAVTTSLPEALGSGRNWDYRFCWIRDATMTLNMLTQWGTSMSPRIFLTMCCASCRTRTMRCRSCMASTATNVCPSRRSTGCRDTRETARYGLGMRRIHSVSTIFTGYC